MTNQSSIPEEITAIPHIFNLMKQEAEMALAPAVAR
jgi:hypothetical protein